jgi:hypothetical protein
MELAALANHRKAIRTEIARYAERFRRMQLDVVARVLADSEISEDRCPPVVALLAMTGLSQVLALEQTLGITTGHDETIAFVGRQIDELENASLRSQSTVPG